MTSPVDAHQASYLTVRCPKCRASKGNECRDKFGLIVKYAHVERQRVYSVKTGTNRRPT